MVTTMDWLAAIRVNDSATGWGGEPTVPAFAALDGVLLLTESMPRGIPTQIIDQNLGEPHSRVVFKPEVDVQGTEDMLARYEGIEKLLCYTFGDPTAPAASVTDITKWDFTYAWQDNLDGIFATGFIHPGLGNAYRYRCMKLAGFELRVQDGLIAYTPTVIADVCLRDVNDATIGKAVVTMPTIGLGIAMRHLKFRMNPQLAIALAVGDELEISDFTLSVQRNLEGDHGNQPEGAVFEPRETGQPTITLAVTSPVYDAAWDAFIEDARENVSETLEPTYQKADMVFTGPLNGTEPRVLAFEFPKISIDAPENPGPGAHQKVPVSLTLQALENDANVAGMTWADSPNQKPIHARIQGVTNAINPLT